MRMTEIKQTLQSLRNYRLFPKRCKPLLGKSDSFWRRIGGQYGDFMKKLNGSDYHWRVITYKDGSKEIAYLKVRQGGLLSGMYPAIYRGVVIPRRLTYDWFAQVKEIKLL